MRGADLTVSAPFLCLPWQKAMAIEYFRQNEAI
jgi:hypothetical protein